MAVDTAAKRFSMLGIDLPMRLSLPVPSGTVSAAERQSFLVKYAGILFGGTGAFKAAWARGANVILGAGVAQ